MILTYLDKPLKGCIESIEKQTYPNIEIIKGTENDFGFTAKKGLGFMRNFLSNQATGDILIFLDSDALMFRNFTSEIVKIFENHRADIVSGLALSPPRRFISFLGYINCLESETRMRKMGEGLVSVASGSCFSVRNVIFKQAGGFIETKTFGEDWFFTAEALKKGLKIWHTNKAKIYHAHDDKFLKYFKQQYKYAQYRVYHYQRFKKFQDEYKIVPLHLPGITNWEEFIYLALYFLRIFAWIFGMFYGFIYYLILHRNLQFSKQNLSIVKGEFDTS